MKVKMTRDYVGRKRGEVFELSDHVAQEWIERGDATEVKTEAKRSSKKDGE